MSAGASQVTVVVPVWDDYVPYLDAALASLRRQSPAPRIVVVDNASTVPVAGADCEIVRAAERLSRGAARNLGLEAVETPLVMFWDADDRLREGALAEMTRALDSAEIRLAACGIVEQDSGRAHRWPSRSSFRLQRHRRVLALLQLVWPRFPVTHSLARTAELRALGGYSDADQSEDWALAAALAGRGRIRLLSLPGCEYRVHGGLALNRRQVLREGRRARRLVRSDAGADRLVRALAPLTGIGSLLVAYVLRPVRAKVGPRSRGD